MNSNINKSELLLCNFNNKFLFDDLKLLIYLWFSSVIKFVHINEDNYKFKQITTLVLKKGLETLSCIINYKYRETRITNR